MAENKRTNFQRERDYERITSLYLRGRRQSDIASELNLTQQQVSYDLKVIQRRWQEKTVTDLDAAKQKELTRIDELEREHWQAWERSKEEKTKSRQEANGKTKDGKTNVTKVVAEKEQMLGNPAFLAGVQWCISERCKLLGLYAPAKNDNLNFDVDLSKLSDAQLERIAKGEDVLKVILDGYQSSKSGGRVGAAAASADSDVDHGD